MKETKEYSIRTLKAEDAKRIGCSSCDKNAELCETVSLYTGGLAFYYYCHTCWKAKEAK